MPKYWKNLKCFWPIKLQNFLKWNISRKKWILKFVFGMQINIKVFYKLILSFWVSVYPGMLKVPKIGSLHIFATSPEKSGGWSWYFCLQINAKVSYKQIASLWVCEAMHAQSTQNNKFAISFQYLRENVKDKVDFLPANTHQTFLQIDAIILGVCSQGCPNYPK